MLAQIQFTSWCNFHKQYRTFNLTLLRWECEACEAEARNRTF